MPTIEVIGADIFYEDRGSGEPLIFLHGGDATHSSWRYQIAHFARQYRVIAPDSRGFGRSKDRSPLHGWDMEIDDLHELIVRLGFEKVNIVGYSMGQVVGRPFTEKYPELVRSLVLVGASYQPEGPTVEAIRRRIVDLERTREVGTWAASDRLHWVFTPEWVEAHPAEFEIYRRCAAESNAETYVKRMLGSIVYANQRPLPTPETLPMPVLFVWGEHDVNTPVLPIYRDALPHAQFAVIPGHGHAVYFSAPDEFNRVVGEFLAKANNVSSATALR
jgi:2-succinyl-6-hydroxy-2,4-cyclohexadiene-1-carboxylate synthase